MPKSNATCRNGPQGPAGQDLEWRHKVTVRHLLTHTSGLPPFKEYWRTSKSKQETLTRIFAEPLDYEPGTKEVYSDLGIILMAEIIERLTGRPLDELAKTYIFSPLGMKDTTFRPAKNLWPWIAPTEFDRNLRNRLVQGEVHDENAFAMGGVSGHAGVFSTAPDLAAFCQMLLNGGVYAHRRILKRATIAQFTAPQPLSNGTRTLGWAVPTEGSSSGHYFSTHSFGHTGFTGTSIWIDPDRQLFVVLLTNRVNPTRENQKIAQVRPALHDAVMQALGFASYASSYPLTFSRQACALYAPPPFSILRRRYNVRMPSLPQERRRTEHRNPASRGLDRLPTKAILRLMNREDRKVAISVGREIPSIARAVDAIVSGIRKGGRLIYVGAGTSGRLAVLDAAECPPTFGVSPSYRPGADRRGKKSVDRRSRRR